MLTQQCRTFSCEIDIWMSGIEILQKPSSGGYIVEQRKVSSTYLNQMEGRESTVATHFSSKLHMKMFANTGPSGDPRATPSIHEPIHNQGLLHFCGLGESSSAH